MNTEFKNGDRVIVHISAECGSGHNVCGRVDDILMDDMISVGLDDGSFRRFDKSNVHPFKYANQILWTDVRPFEVVRHVSDKCIEVREMAAVIDPTWKREFIPGGFAGHTVNNRSQKWIITSDADAPVIRIRRHRDGWWRAANGNRFRPSIEPVKFHDYNF